jgi:hypothetical protein
MRLKRPHQGCSNRRESNNSRCMRRIKNLWENNSIKQNGRSPDGSLQKGTDRNVHVDNGRSRLRNVIFRS